MDEVMRARLAMPWSLGPAPKPPALSRLMDMQTASVIRTYNWPWFWAQVGQAVICEVAQLKVWQQHLDSEPLDFKEDLIRLLDAEREMW